MSAARVRRGALPPAASGAGRDPGARSCPFAGTFSALTASSLPRDRWVRLPGRGPLRVEPMASPTTAEPLVRLSGVNKWFGDLHVLQDVDLTIDRGEVVVIIGPSGSGKSTLCRAI